MVKRAALSHERIVEAAVAMADEAGVEALTMRGLGERLGVKAMSLYKYFATKDELLDALVERVAGEIPLEVASPDVRWEERVRARALAMRRVLLRHRWAAMLMESRLVPGASRLALHEQMLATLRGAGFEVELAYHAYQVIDSYLYGFVLQEVAWPFEPEQRPEVLDELMPHVDAAQYPNLAEIMAFVGTQAASPEQPAGPGHAAYEAEFLFGLELILEGLERRRLGWCSR
jgi:AcrR family transcriptional regulator